MLMTHLAKFALLGTVALLAAVGCQREPVDVNPNYDPETKEVVTDFVFNVAAAESPKTKMTDAVVQATTSNTFRGIERAILYAFSQKTAGGDLDDGKHLWTNAGQAEKTFDLGMVMASSSIDPTNTPAGGTPPQSRRVLELSMPSETNTFLFYGTAIKDGTDIEQGVVDMHLSNEPVKSHIDIHPIIEGNIGTFTYGGTVIPATSGTIAEKFRETATLFSCLMTHIVNAGWANTEAAKRAANEQGPQTRSFTANGITKTYPDDFDGKETLHWSDYGAALKGSKKSPINPEKDLMGLEENLANAFNTLTTLNTVGGIEEFRAGSANALLFQLKDLYAVINGVSNATPTSIEEAVAKDMADVVLSVISDYYKSDSESWQPLSTIKAKISSSVKVPGLLVANNSFAHVPETYTQFPENFHLPVGSTCVKVNTVDGSIVYQYNLLEIDNSDLGGTAGSTTDIYSYSYPPELCYFSNSSVIALSKERAVSQYPDGAEQWNASDWWNTNWSGYSTHVSSDSKSVAMKNMVNYGTSLLRSVVKYKAGVTTFNDNYKLLHGNLESEHDNTFVLTDADPENGIYLLDLSLTGVLIGGQPNSVGWNYLPVKESATAGEYEQAAAGDFYQMVYDHLPSPIPLTSSDSDPVYTLVFDNFVSDNDQQKVYVALEFINNGHDFWGMHNLVRQGGKFYIIGILDPKDTTGEGHTATAPVWDLDYHTLPPYSLTTGATIQTARVFIQDYTTSAKFSLGQNSLKSAYITVPDLRSSQLSFGMSVDMKWETGMSFDVELGK